uniref:CHAT domain-containing protein n=1 Tax=Amphimedon queenslandica TaxID=400682 RepID=A0A1X7T6K1_AMPQE
MEFGVADESKLKIFDKVVEDELAVVTSLKSILQSVQEQYEAMYYEEMKLMLTKHSHLAETSYDSALLLFGGGLASLMLKEYEESFDKFREAGEILEKFVDSDSSYSNDLSLCLMYMGDVESSQGHYKSAPDYFERAIASHQLHGQPSRFEEAFKLDRTTRSVMLSKHALSLRNNDCVVDSEKRYKQATFCPDATPSDIIIARTGLGNLLHSVGSNEKAVPEYLAAIDIAEKEKDHLSLAWAHGNLGNTYLSLGKREKGLSHLQTSLDLTLDHDFDPSSISRALNNLGTAYQSLNELDKAELYFDQALSQAIYASDVVGQARAYGNIGNVYMLLKDFLKAIPHYTEVLRLSRDRSTVYVAYHNRGCALFELAEKKKGEQYQFTKRGEFQFIAIGPDTGDMDYKHQSDEELDDHTTELYQQSLKDLKKVIKNVESAFANSSSSTIGLDLYLSLFHINAKTFQRAQDCAFNLRDHYQSLTIAEQVRARTLGELLLKRKSHQLPTTFSTPLNIDAIKLAVELLPDPYTPVVVLSYTGTRLLVWVLIFDGKTVSVNSFEQEPDEELFGKQLDMYLRYELADDLTGNIDLYGEEEEKEVEIEEEGEKTDEEKEIESDKETKQESDEEEKKEYAEKYSSKYSSNMDTNKLIDTEILEKATEPLKKEKKDKKSGPARKRKILSDLYKMIAKPLEAILKASCLVILSSCDSGRGKFKGDEIQGMSRSFLLAGAAAVMTSLWKVPDQSASYFMQYFYRYLLDGHTSSVSLQKSIQSIRSIHHFSQVIHWGGYQLTGSDVRIVVEVSDQDKMVFKALGCPEGVSPFPHLELLQQLENNLLSSTENNIQIIYGPCGTNPAETVKDFIAKHHSAYQSIYWCNACHPVVMNDVIKIMEKVVCEYGDHQSSMLLVVDSVTVDNVADLIPLSCCKNIQLILVAQSISDYKEIAREVDIKLKTGVNSLLAVKPLTELECAQRIVYSLVRNEENDITCYDSKDINSLASLCSGSPSVVKMAERVAAVGTSALKIDDDEDLSVLDIELKSCHEEVMVVKLSQSKKEVKEYSSSLHISSIINSLCLSPVSRILLNCVSVFHGVPIPKLFLSSLENEIINASSSSSSDSPLTSLSLSSLSSSHIIAIDCVAELLTCQCIVSYPSPVIVQASSAKAASSIDTTLYTVPDIISEYMWSNMDTVDKLFAIGIAYRTIKRKAKNMAVYSHGLVNQLLERFEDIENGPSSDVDFDEKTIQEIKDDCYVLLLSLKELFRTN